MEPLTPRPIDDPHDWRLAMRGEERNADTMLARCTKCKSTKLVRMYRDGRAPRVTFKPHPENTPCGGNNVR